MCWGLWLPPLLLLSWSPLYLKSTLPQWQPCSLHWTSLWGEITKVFTLLMSFHSKQKHFIAGDCACVSVQACVLTHSHLHTHIQVECSALESQHINTSINFTHNILISPEVKIPDHTHTSETTHTFTSTSADLGNVVCSQWHLGRWKIVKQSASNYILICVLGLLLCHVNKMPGSVQYSLFKEYNRWMHWDHWGKTLICPSVY